MPLRRAKPFPWFPTGCSDAVDGSTAFSGAMASLSNLVPSPSTDKQWVPRPASIQLSNFPGFTSPQPESGLLIVGDIAYGMVPSGRNPGFDEPFCYDIANNVFRLVNGILAGNVPASPPASGAWTPPIIAQVGSRVIVTHTGFPGGAIKFGWFDVSGFTSASLTASTHSNTTLDTISSNAIAAGWQPGMLISSSAGDIPAGTTIVSINAAGTSAVLSQAATGSNAGSTITVTGGTPANPLWGAGDTNINNLPSVPVGVAQFNGRAYFGCGVNGIAFSDSLLPCNRTNATQALTTNDGLAVTAIGPLLLSAPVTGGIVQALIAFEGVAKMQQITGDPATNNLAMNALPVATGTLAPLSVVPCERGLAFVSPEGLRIVDFNGTVSQPIGDHGTGVAVPFIDSLVPSRIVAAANVDTIRITATQGFSGVVNQQEWCFDLTRKVWHGPHTFPFRLLQAWRNTYVGVPVAVSGASLFQSDIVPSFGSSYIENNSPINVAAKTVLLPDTEEMAENVVNEMTVGLNLPAGSSPAVVTCLDENGNLLSQASVTNPGAGVFRQWTVPITGPIVFKQMDVTVQAVASAGLTLGPIRLKYQILGYVLQDLPAIPIPAPSPQVEPMDNLLINPSMEIDQANEGASVTLASGTEAYIVDCWLAQFHSATATATAQRVADAPSGFTNSLKLTVTAGAAVGANDYLKMHQKLEGNAITGTGFGAAGAASVTLSFWVKSSIGNYIASGSLINAALNRSYPFNFTIVSAATWQQIVIVIPGDVAGTWVTSGTATGLVLSIAASVGSALQGTVNTWSAAAYYGTATNTNSVLATTNATFQVTGVKLEINTSATGFQRRPFATELALCQRTFEKTYSIGTAIGTATTVGAQSLFLTMTAATIAAASQAVQATFKVEKRVAPTITGYSPVTGTSGKAADITAAADVTFGTGQIGVYGFAWAGTLTGAETAMNLQAHWTADSRP